MARLVSPVTARCWPCDLRPRRSVRVACLVEAALAFIARTCRGATDRLPPRARRGRSHRARSSLRSPRPGAPGHLGVQPGSTVKAAAQLRVVGASVEWQDVLRKRRGLRHGTTVLVTASRSRQGVVARFFMRRPGARPGRLPEVRLPPDHLLESELFGYERVAFPRAACKRGRWVASARPLLDESRDELSAQAKFCACAVKKFKRLGGTRLKANIRVIAATNRICRKPSSAASSRDLLTASAASTSDPPPATVRRYRAAERDVPAGAWQVLASGAGLTLRPTGAAPVQWPGNVGSSHVWSGRDIWRVRSSTRSICSAPSRQSRPTPLFERPRTPRLPGSCILPGKQYKAARGSGCAHSSPAGSQSG